MTFPRDDANRSWLSVELHDWDGDGDPDMFVLFLSGPYINRVVRYENVTERGGALTFADRGPIVTDLGPAAHRPCELRRLGRRRAGRPARRRRRRGRLPPPPGHPPRRRRDVPRRRRLRGSQRHAAAPGLPTPRRRGHRRRRRPRPVRGDGRRTRLPLPQRRHAQRSRARGRPDARLLRVHGRQGRGEGGRLRRRRPPRFRRRPLLGAHSSRRAAARLRPAVQERRHARRIPGSRRATPRAARPTRSASSPPMRCDRAACARSTGTRTARSISWPETPTGSSGSSATPPAAWPRSSRRPCACPRVGRCFACLRRRAGSAGGGLRACRRDRLERRRAEGPARRRRPRMALPVLEPGDGRGARAGDAAGACAPTGSRSTARRAAACSCATGTATGART